MRTWHIVGLLPISRLYVSGGGMNYINCGIYVYHLWLFVFFPMRVFLSSREIGACPVTTDFIMRVNVRATTTPYSCTFPANERTAASTGECRQMTVSSLHHRHFRILLYHVHTLATNKRCTAAALSCSLVENKI